MTPTGGAHQVLRSERVERDAGEWVVGEVRVGGDTTKGGRQGFLSAPPGAAVSGWVRSEGCGWW